MKTTLDRYSVVDRYRFISDIVSTKEIEFENNIDCFEQFYRLNNSLRYCNGNYYKFQDNIIEKDYKDWLKSDDYKKKSFNLYYGNGTVD